MIDDIVKAIESIYDEKESVKFNVAIGFFLSYASSEADSLGKRFVNLDLHFRDKDGGTISAGRVPVLQIGSKNTIDDFRLESGDELLVLFTDISLEQWKDTSGSVPQTLKNEVRSSKNHAIAIPVVSHHYSQGIISSDIDSSVARRIGVKSGKKIQIGNDATDLLKVLYDLLNGINNLSFSDGDTLASALQTLITTTLTTLQTNLATITKV